jgi:hypothetical protein
MFFGGQGDVPMAGSQSFLKFAVDLTFRHWLRKKTFTTEATE